MAIKPKPSDPRGVLIRVERRELVGEVFSDPYGENTLPPIQVALLLIGDAIGQEPRERASRYEFGFEGVDYEVTSTPRDPATPAT